MTDSRSRCVVEISTDTRPIVYPTLDRLLTDCRPTIDRLSTDYRPSLDRLSTAISTDGSLDTTYSKHEKRWIEGHFSLAPAKSCAVKHGSITNFDRRYIQSGCVVRRKREKTIYFFSDSGKALQLKRIILWVCEIEVSDTDELPKFWCRSCHDKVLRLNKNLEIFASTCQSTQKELERELKTSRQENMKKRSRTGNSTQSTENPRKIPHSIVTSARIKKLKGMCVIKNRAITRR